VTFGPAEERRFSRGNLAAGIETSAAIGAGWADMKRTHWVVLFLAIVVAAVAGGRSVRRGPPPDGPEARAIHRYLASRGHQDVRVERIDVDNRSPGTAVAWFKFLDRSGRRQWRTGEFHFRDGAVSEGTLSRWRPPP
jgi:hypothetical protein